MSASCSFGRQNEPLMLFRQRGRMTTRNNTFSKTTAFSWNPIIMVAGPSASASCVNFKIPYSDFCITITGKTQLLVDLCQSWSAASNFQLSDLWRIVLSWHSKKGFWSDKNYLTKGRCHKMCSYAISNCYKKGAWFEMSKVGDNNASIFIIFPSETSQKKGNLVMYHMT